MTGVMNASYSGFHCFSSPFLLLFFPFSKNNKLIRAVNKMILTFICPFIF